MTLIADGSGNIDILIFQVGDKQPAAWGVRTVSRLARSGSFCNSVQVQQTPGDALPSREVVELLWLFLFLFLDFSSKKLFVQ